MCLRYKGVGFCAPVQPGLAALNRGNLTFLLLVSVLQTNRQQVLLSHHDNMTKYDQSDSMMFNNDIQLEQEEVVVTSPISNTSATCMWNGSFSVNMDSLITLIASLAS